MSRFRMRFAFLPYQKRLSRISALLLPLIVLLGSLQPAAWVKAAMSATLADPCKIMPLGDSITMGKSSGIPDTEPTKFIAYRKDLWELLAADPEYGPIDFVGSLTNGQFYTGFDPHHEGHAGYTDDQVESEVYDWLVANPADIVLLHIGTNGLGQSPDDVKDILDEIDQVENVSGDPIWVILARIINRITYSSTTTAFNDYVQDMAEDRISLGDKIVIVDMEDGADLIYEYYNDDPPGDMWDELHPYHTGYAKMATVWKEGIDQIYLQACNGAPLITTDLGNRTDVEGSVIAIELDATDPEGDSLEFSAMGLPDGLGIDPVSGTINGTISFEAAATSPYDTSVTVTDTVSQKQDTRTFTWTITNTNRPPVIDPQGNQSSPEGGPIAPLQIDAQDPDEDGITFDDNGTLPDGLSIDANTGEVSGSLDFDSAGSYPVTITVTDDHSSNPLSASVSFTWTVTNTNRAPLLANPGDQTNAELHTVNLQLQASDPDLNDSHTFNLDAGSLLPAGLQLDQDTGVISGMIAAGAAANSPYSVTVIVKDNGSPQLSSQVTFNWNVAPYNNPSGDPNTVFLPLVIH